MKKIFIYQAKGDEHTALLEVYREAAQNADGLIRRPEEITEAYVSGFIKASIENGLISVAEIENRVIGVVHAHTPSIFAFQHLLSDLSIAVHPKYQGMGIGTKLLESFLEKVKRDFVHILRVELYTRSHNEKNIALYEKLGFMVESRLDRKIYMGDGHFHTPVQMVWFNPNYRRGN